MLQSITLSRSSLAKLLQSFYPNPDDPGPWGPIGPVIRAALDRVTLNPQPLPPGPQPDPWRAAMFARLTIDQAVSQYQLAEALLGREAAGRASEAARSQIQAFVDEWCGTHPRPWPRPWPWPPVLDPKTVQPAELLVAGAQFETAAQLKNPLQETFSAAAAQLIDVGLQRLRETQTA